nr:Zn-dependent hydrolase [Acuticoccus kandeliae]
MSGNLRIDGARLMDRLAALGTIGALPGGGVKRLALTDEDKVGRDRLVSWMRDLGLSVEVDVIGNIIGTRAGSSDAAPILLGSHIDTVATGGLYDGALGVLAGLEIVETLNDAGITTHRPIAVAAFTNEEGARFAPDMMGSGAQTGALPLDDMLRAKGIDGTRVGEELDRIGYRGDLPVGAIRPAAFLELHIEQGPVLEAEGYAIGAVEGVQGISWTEFTIEGVSNHAGTTPMAMRHDAGVVAAEIALLARRIATEAGPPQVATVGSIMVEPNLVNVVPDKAVLTVDLRHTDERDLQRAERRLHEGAQAAVEAEGCAMAARSLARFEPVRFDTRLVDLVAENAAGLGLGVKRMPSGAGHDAQMFAPICPTAMVFVPSRHGLSHNVHEYTAPDQIEAGANVLLTTVLQLAGEGSILDR